MRIGIDARFFGPGIGTGIGRYSQRLIEELEHIDLVNEYRVFLRRENIDLYRPANPRFTKVLAPWRWYTLDEQIHFPRAVRRERVDFTHYLHFNVPLTAPRPFIVTIHDLILSKFPTQRASTLEPATYWFKQLAYRAVIRRAVSRSLRVITVTDFTRQDIADHFGYPRERIDMTYEGYDVPSQAGNDARLVPRGVRSPYVICVGNAYPHKNLERLVDAFSVVRSRRRNVQLVLVGREDYFYRRLEEYVTNKGYGDFVVFTGYVDDDVLDTLYRGAALCVFPSLYEGFGLPGIEAMARRVPVVAARASCLPEVYGDAAHYFDPLDVGDMTQAIGRVLDDTAYAGILRERGAVQSSKYHWRRMAEQTLTVYNTVGANIAK